MATSDEVHIEPQTASNGIAQWELGAKSAQDAWNKATASAKGFGAPWGGDEAGSTFAQNYGGNALMNNPQVAEAFQKIVDTGTNVRTAIQKSLASDPQQAGKVKNVIQPGVTSNIH